MKKLLKSIAVLTLLFGLNQSTQAQQIAVDTPANDTSFCKNDIPFGMPIYKALNFDVTLICHMAYLTLHNNKAKVPVWTSFSLTDEHAMGCLPRKDAFKPDILIPHGKRAEMIDYLNSGYDKGHLASDASMSWAPKVQAESFLLSNMAPQIHAYNAGVWEALERRERVWATDRKEVIVLTGPLIDGYDKTIGPNKVVVPPAFFKIIFDKNKPEAVAAIIPHKDLPMDLTPWLVSIADVEKASNITIPVMEGLDKTKKTTLWPADLTAWQHTKQTTCH